MHAYTVTCIHTQDLATKLLVVPSADDVCFENVFPHLYTHEHTHTNTHTYTHPPTGRSP